VPGRTPQRTPRLAPETRREQLLDATNAVLAETGFGNLTVEAIAQAAGVTRPVIYDTFGDLDSLLLALIERADRRVTGKLAEILGDGVPANPNPDHFLIDTIDALLSAVREDPSSFRLVLMPPPGNSAELNFRLHRARGELAGRWTGASPSAAARADSTMTCAPGCSWPSARTPRD
jgi:AcrR family transcriptional regulator